MSVAGQELRVALFAVVLFAAATVVALHGESKAAAWIAVAAFFSFSLLAAWSLWRLL